MGGVRSKLANLIAIFGTIPDTTAPRPLYNPRGVSLAAICFPVAKNPSGLSYHQPMDHPSLEMNSLLAFYVNGIIAF
jgi:hypothetical protein